MQYIKLSIRTLLSNLSRLSLKFKILFLNFLLQWHLVSHHRVFVKGVDVLVVVVKLPGRSLALRPLPPGLLFQYALRFLPFILLLDFLFDLLQLVVKVLGLLFLFSSFNFFLIFLKFLLPFNRLTNYVVRFKF